MPGDAPVSKHERAKSYGATVVLSDSIPSVNREVTAAQVAERISAAEGLTLLHPFEDKDVIVGQGTCALEIAGCCLAMERDMPQCAVFAVEPDGYDDHVRSLRAGERLAVQGNPSSICDSLQAAAPGRNTFPVTRRCLSGAVSVSDAEVRAAMRVAFETLQIVLEPGGATGLAALLSGKLPLANLNSGARAMCVVASGGNLSLDKYAAVMGCPKARLRWAPWVAAFTAGAFAARLLQGGAGRVRVGWK